MPNQTLRTSQPLARRRPLWRIAALAMALLFIAGAVWGVRGAGRWLICEDALEPADVIVVLSGSMPLRAEEAARIFRLGYAREVWVTRPAGAAAELAGMGIRYTGEEEYSRAALLRLGVPEASVRILPGTIDNTEQEIEQVARTLRLGGKKRAMIVTSREHTRRVRALWTRLAGNDLQLVVRGAPQDPFDADHWWRHTRDALSVVREVLGLANVWAGLPVRPRSD
ncbi:MAG: YdcF family protein [Acidobacteriia bacterium]|nr:YdcF family protein [Terriglobia bacterium]